MKHQPRKRFGQHFLTDQSVIHAIVAAIRPAAEDNLIEIGPGLGALTQPLAAALNRLHVVEIDRDIVERLRSTYSPARVTIHAGDVLNFDFSQLPPQLRVVGNLPYNISTPLLFHLAAFAARIRDMHFMLQKEVVDRMVASPGGGDYGRLSVMLQYRFEIDRLFAVQAGAFSPPPRVDSAVVRLVPRPSAAMTALSPAALEEVVRRAFTQRRKTLRNSLAGLIPAAEIAGLGIDPGLRAENLSVADFVAIGNHVAAEKPSGAG